MKIGVTLAAATAILLRYDQPAVNRFAQQPSPWAVHTSRVGNFAPLIGGVALLYGAGRLTHSETATQMGISSISALTHSYVITQALKLITRRQRPDGSNHWSLPSGHAMTSFALAAAISSHPRAPRWVRIVAPAGAGAIAFSRFGARKHYPSDIALGSTLGWLIGRAVSHR